MSGERSRPSSLFVAISILELIYHGAVRTIRKTHGNAVLGLLINIAQTLLLVVVFYVMFLFIGNLGGGIRGDPMLYVMTGIFLFMVHVKSVGAVVQAEGPTSPMMNHAPMNTIVAIGAAALGELYIQILSMLAVLFLYNAIWTTVEVFDPLGALLMMLLAWFSGVAIGLIFLAIKALSPAWANLGSQIYSRVNMVASGKMFVANSLPGFVLPYFTWNPLFHIIDQARGFAFINYAPHSTSVVYPVAITLAAMLLGLMAESQIRRRASISWSARH
jgi:ABC-type polysaccharide/polyol phosphate export permease